MSNMTWEIIILLVLFFVIGCIFGCFARRRSEFGRRSVAETRDAAPQTLAASAEPSASRVEPAPATASAPVAATAALETPKAKASAKKSTASPKAPVKKTTKAKPKAAAKKATTSKATSRRKSGPTKPRSLQAARRGGADDLKKISGIGPKLEKTLNELGYYHFDQIAKWNRSNVEWVDEHLNFKGRVDREEWIPQAKKLAAGK